MTEKEIEKYKSKYGLMEMKDIEIVSEAKATLMESRKIRGPGYTRIEDVSLLAIGILLDLVQNQQAALKKKDKMIDYMIKWIRGRSIYNVDSHEKLKQYFEKQVKKEG